MLVVNCQLNIRNKTLMEVLPEVNQPHQWVGYGLPGVCPAEWSWLLSCYTDQQSYSLSWKTEIIKRWAEMNIFIGGCWFPGSHVTAAPPHLSTAACRALILVCIIWRTPENSRFRVMLRHLVVRQGSCSGSSYYWQSCKHGNGSKPTGATSYIISKHLNCYLCYFPHNLDGSATDRLKENPF